MNALPADVVLRARAGAVGLSTVLQVAELEGLTGRIALGASGHVDLVDGVPVDATCGAWSGLDALCELFLADVDELVVHRRTVPAADPLGRPGGLVLEGARRLDDWSRLAGVVPTIARPCGEDTSDRLLRVHQATDGELAVFELALLLDEPRSWTAHAVAALLDHGALTHAGTKEVVDDQPAAPPPAPDTTDVFELLDRGRDELRRGHLEAAQTAFAQAVALAPEHRIANQNLRRVERLMERAR